LIANDDSFQLETLSRLFEWKGYHVVNARNGHEAYESVLKNIKNPEEMFDLIILDLQMPIANGYEACQNILKLYKERNMFA
jgi:CheY-like chemotaxis protein